MYARGSAVIGNTGRLRKLQHVCKLLLTSNILPYEHHCTVTFRGDTFHGAAVGPSKACPFNARTEHVAQRVDGLHTHQRFCVFVNFSVRERVVHGVIDKIKKSV